MAVRRKGYREFIKHLLSGFNGNENKDEIMEKITSLWSELQQQDRLPKGILAANCEAELHELMEQIDMMMATKYSDWEHQIQSLNNQLDVRQRENVIHKTTIEQKNKEISHLKKQLESHDQSQHDVDVHYNSQLSLLKSEVQKMKRDYEKLNRKHLKQAKDVEAERNRSNIEISDYMAQIEKLTNKLEEYRQKSKDWELQKRTMQKQLEGIEAARKGLVEKCEFIQSQSQTYQSQLDRRRQMLDSTEMTFKNQITQLEAQLQLKDDTISMKETKIDKLRASLEDAMNAHRKAMDDNERLLEDLRQTNGRVRKLEEEKIQLEGDLNAKEDLLHAMSEDSSQQSKDVTDMERALAEKDEIIKSLGDSRNREESENVRMLKESLHEAKEESRTHKKTEKKMKEEISRLQAHLQKAVEECETMSADLDKKKAELDKLGPGEVKRLRTEISRLTDQLQTVQNTHKAEIEGMRLEVKKLTKDIHDRDAAMATLSEQSSSMEQQLRSETEFLQKRTAELQVSNAQIEALRLENRHLRQTILQQAHANADKSQSEDHLRTLHNSYSTTVARLEQENQQLKNDCTYMREEMNEMEEKFEEQLRLALRDAEMSSHDERRIQRIEDDANRKVQVMQERLNSTIQRYEEEINVLRTEKARLEEEFDRAPVYRSLNEDRIQVQFNGHRYSDRHRYKQDVMDTSNNTQHRYEDDIIDRRNSGLHRQSYDDDMEDMRSNGSNGNQRYHEDLTDVRNIGNQSFETILSSKAMSISESVNGYYDSDDREIQKSRNSVSQRFLESENKRAKDLELLIDSHIEQLKIGTEKTIKKNKR